MSHEIINSWVEKARQNGKEAEAAQQGVKVIRASDPNRGNLIMEIAEKIRPWLTKLFANVRDENGMLVQPARIRGIALNVAQRIVAEQEAKANA